MFRHGSHPPPLYERTTTLKRKLAKIVNNATAQPPNMHKSVPRKILITGAASGIGAGMARLLAASGHHIVVSDLDAAAAEAMVQEIVESGAAASALALDVGDIDAIAAAPLQEVDVLINNAGLQHVARLENFSMQRWQLLVQVMLTGVAALSQQVLPGMRARGFGRIINIGSVHSLVGSPYKSAYVAAKHGLIGFARVLALETGDSDITVNTICPSYVKTALVEKQIAAQAREHGISEQQVIDEIMLKPMPKGCFIEYDELAGSAEFLLSHAARNINGQTIVIDGGWTAR